jgi:hypothetical protein
MVLFKDDGIVSVSVRDDGQEEVRKNDIFNRATSRLKTPCAGLEIRAFRDRTTSL